MVLPHQPQVMQKMLEALPSEEKVNLTTEIRDQVTLPDHDLKERLERQGYFEDARLQAVNVYFITHAYIYIHIFTLK